MKRIVLLVTLTAISLLTVSGVLLARASQKPQVSTQVLGLDELKLEKLVNDYRVSQGLPELLHDESLCKSAAAKAEDMVARRYYEHDTPDGVDFSEFIKPHKDFYKAAENIGMSNENSESAIVKGWIASKRHRENIVGSFTNHCVQTRYYGTYSALQKSTVIVHHFTE